MKDGQTEVWYNLVEQDPRNGSWWAHYTGIRSLAEAQEWVRTSTAGNPRRRYGIQEVRSVKRED